MYCAARFLFLRKVRIVDSRFEGFLRNFSFLLSVKQRSSKRLALLCLKNGKAHVRIVLPLLGDLYGDKQNTRLVSRQGPPRMEQAGRAIARP